MAQTKIKAGLFEGIIGNGTDGYFLMSNGDGTMTWSSVVINPTITDVDYPGTATAADPAGGETITLTGTGFKTGATVTVGGTSAPAVSYVSETQITFTTPAKAAGDYDIVVTNTDTGSATFINGISFNGIPSWTTAAGSLGTFASNTTISTITLQATEPDAGTITFNITNGALPTGLSLTGANIDGTTSILNADTLYTFTVTATDDENQATPRTFTITVKKEFISSENFTINTYTGNGSTQSIEGKIGTAAEFNGSSSKITSTGLGLTGNPIFSVSFWINPDANAGTPFMFGTNSSGQAFLTYINTSNKLNFGRWLDSLGDTTASIPNNTWTHVAISNNAGAVQVYINGTADLSFSTTYNITGNNLYIGSANTTQYFNGKIDQFRIFNKALSSSEVTTLYGESNTSTTKSTTDIFADGSGVALYEFEKGAIDTGGTSGYIGSGGVFNGSSSKISLGDLFDFSTESFSISCWVKLNSLSATQCVFSQWSATSTNRALLSTIDTSGTFAVIEGYGSSNNGSSNPSSTTTLTTNNWFHLVYTRSGTEGTIYVNGNEEDRNALGNTINNSTEDFQLGMQESSSKPFNGTIDQLRIFNKALSSSEVTTLYGETSASATKSTTDIFDDGSGLALYELEGNANDTGGVSGKFGSAAHFNGSSSQIDLNYASLGMGVNNFSYSFWFKLNSTSGAQTFFQVLSEHINYGLRINDTYNLQSSPTNSSGGAEYIGSNVTLDTNWHHVAYVKSSTNGHSLWYDGTKVAEDTNFTGNVQATTTNKTTLGSATNDINWLNGFLDDVRFYSDELTSTEIGYIYNNTTASIPTDNLVAYYKLDGNSTDEQGSYDGVDTNVSYAYNGTATSVSYAYDGTPTNVGFVGTSFQPDLVWVKSRGYAEQHGLFDSVRGANLWLHSETTQAQTNYSGNYGVLSFDSNGFSIGNGTAINRSGDNHVAWCWKAASSDSTNTDGSITSTVRANQDAGFSIVKYTGNGTVGATIGHGLSSAPELTIIKKLDTVGYSGGNWVVGYGSYNTDLYLNSSAAAGTNNYFWNAAPTSTVVELKNDWFVNYNGSEYIMYNFHSVSGYQKIGSFSYSVGYSENVGFEPRFLLMKKTSSTGSWYMIDNKRVSGSNNYGILANSAAAEDTGTDYITFTSTGFTTTYSDSGTYIYLAIA